jgi:hypothetical protein
MRKVGKTSKNRALTSVRAKIRPERAIVNFLFAIALEQSSAWTRTRWALCGDVTITKIDIIGAKKRKIGF